MTEPQPKSSTAEFERALAAKGEGKYVLRLYVTGATQKSARAIRNLRRICDQYLEGRYELEVIDIYQEPLIALDGRILAAPTLEKSAPAPLRRLIGDLSDRERVIAALDIHAKEPDG